MLWPRILTKTHFKRCGALLRRWVPAFKATKVSFTTRVVSAMLLSFVGGSLRLRGKLGGAFGDGA